MYPPSWNIPSFDRNDTIASFLSKLGMFQKRGHDYAFMKSAAPGEYLILICTLVAGEKLIKSSAVERPSVEDTWNS